MSLWTSLLSLFAEWKLKVLPTKRSVYRIVFLISLGAWVVNVQRIKKIKTVTKLILNEKWKEDENRSRATRQREKASGRVQTGKIKVKWMAGKKLKERKSGKMFFLLFASCCWFCVHPVFLLWQNTGYVASCRTFLFIFNDTTNTWLKRQNQQKPWKPSDSKLAFCGAQARGWEREKTESNGTKLLIFLFHFSTFVFCSFLTFSN